MLTYRRAKSKPTRVPPRPPARSGAGLIPPSCPVHKAPASLSDMEWATRIEAIYETSWDEDAAMEQRAAEADAQDRLERGYIHQDVAEMISSTRV
jgi:hypothetical protein